jgi:hypothetical protein
MFKTTETNTLKQDKKCQPCWYIILSTMSGSTTINSPFSVVPGADLTFARSSKYNYTDHGMEWNGITLAKMASIVNLSILFSNLK